MKHSYNKRCFRNLSSSVDRLPALYGMLIAIELAIKEHDYRQKNKWSGGHRIVAWLSSIDNHASIRLREVLERLSCTDRNGKPTQVDADNYPGLRYLRHEEDFEAGATEEQLQSACEVAEDIVLLLRNRGYNL